MVKLSSTRRDWWLRDTSRSIGVDYTKVFAPVASHDLYDYNGDCRADTKLVACLSIGCQISFPAWILGRRDIY